MLPLLKPFPTDYVKCRALLKKLDVQVPHSVYKYISNPARPRAKAKPKAQSLKPSEIEAIYNRRREFSIGAHQLKTFLETAEMPGEDEVGAAYLFADYPEGKLPKTFLDGLESLVWNAGFEVAYLICYKRPSNMPRGVIEVDANQYLSWDEFSTYIKQGFKLVHLADWIRIMAMGQSSHRRAVFVDGDTVWLKAALPDGAYHGFWIATYNINNVTWVS